MKVLSESDLKFIEKELLLLNDFNNTLDPNSPTDASLIKTNIARVEELERIVNDSFKELAKPKLVRFN